MSTTATRRRERIAEGPPAVEMLEEAIHLLRRAPWSAWSIYAVGSAIWTAGFLQFWARMSWFAPSSGERAWAALLLAGAFVGLKVVQADFAGRLLALRTGLAPTPLTFRRALALAGAQLRLQPWGLIALPVAAVATVPFGWVHAFYQTATVLGTDSAGSTKLRVEAWKLARLWPRQNHALLAYVFAFGLVVWINLLTCAYVLPQLARMLLGVENLFALRGFAGLNTTLFAFVTVLAWLALDPLAKAIHVLRVFHGRAQHTGDDLREAFPAPRRSRPRTAAAVLTLLLLLGVFGVARTGRAADPPPVAPETAVPVPTAGPATRVSPNELDHAIDETLADRDFQWSLRPNPAAQQKTAEDEDGFFQRKAKWLKRQGRRFLAWIDSLGSERKSKPIELRDRPLSTGGGHALAQMLIYVLLAAVVLALLWVIWSAVRQARRVKRSVVAEIGSAPVTPDLRDESVTAAQLPADGWLELARQKMAAGEWRLALRALYLSTLARLADEGLVSLAKHKTNLDYEREVARRALTHVEVIERFRGRRRSFEDVWYGDVPAAEPLVREWFDELERTTPVPPAMVPEAATRP